MQNNETSTNTNNAIQKITSIPLVASSIQYFETKRSIKEVSEKYQQMFIKMIQKEFVSEPLV